MFSDEFYPNTELPRYDTYGGHYFYRGDAIHELPEWLQPAYLRRNAHADEDEELQGEDAGQLQHPCHPRSQGTA